MTPVEIAEIIKMAKENGLATLEVEGLSFSFKPEAPVTPAKPPMKEYSIEELADKLYGAPCRCGHPKYNHRGDVGCIQGCPIATCVTLATTPV